MRPGLYCGVSKKEKVEGLIARCHGKELDAHYLAYFECFNEGLFFEAHEVLEPLWLADRKAVDANFYKGLIQFAGSFVHLQKGRYRPAERLLGMAKANLEPYPNVHWRLDLGQLRRTIDDWIRELKDVEVGHSWEWEGPVLRLS